ncbi:undecaprenyl-phosphate glucose phosphotransferase [Motiliproteus coralliicola]|uniref:Undecaprenyl-phosphate glucose phosphotransferase n=1 Tax=Motiliproteus coralliicola TaxID=2283196 RepID=A0A369WLJ1_9GAMM|nr:undecaprenyl-phosphate glucose phosphotransferase [Motiliproteus coralliicola]RDE22582.1 undecaprenyl-phosphate glucose phosphotransferase [Motiliproteus coralliicola]
MKYSGFLKEHSHTLMWTLRGLDWLVLVLSCWVAMSWAIGTSTFHHAYTVAVVVASFASFTVYPFFSIYRTWRGATKMEEARALFLGWTSLFAVLAMLAVLTKTSEEYSRLWFGLWYSVGLAWLVVSRFLMRGFLGYIRENGLNSRRIVIVGSDELGQRVATTLLSENWTGLQVAGFFTDDPQPTLNTFLNGLSVLGNLDSCPDYVRQHKVDQVWICLPLEDEQRMRALFESLDDVPVDLRFVPDIFGFQLINHSVSEIAGLPVIDLSASPMDGISRVLKGIEDRVLSLIILLLISPILAVIAGAIKLTSPGPIIFKQRRYGINGEEIKVYKFRSMTAQDNGAVVKQAQKHDSRITPLGAFLRRTSLDELPQFFNVLQGRMSIVGPRPHAVAHNEQYKGLIGGYMKRHLVKPGITGWAQINGWRGETDTLDKMEKRVEYDLYYIENWSLWFDLKIIFLTIFKGFVHKNAY